MSKIFCDVGEVPKNKKRGSMKECAELGQIKYWGEKKADSKMISLVTDKKKKKKSLSDLNKEYVKLTTKLAGIVGKISRIKKDLPYEKDEKKAKKMEKDKKELEKEVDKIRDLLIPLKEKINKAQKAKDEEKKKSKKSSKKMSRTKRTSKKHFKNHSKKTL